MNPDLFEEIVRIRRERRSAALATVVATKGSTPAKVPARMLVYATGRTRGTIGGGCVEADVIRAARDVMDTGAPRTLSFRLSGEEAERTGIACGGIVDVMIEALEDPRAVLVGGGHVSQAVARLAAASGYGITVVDDRPDFANAERFPEADEIVVAELDAIGEQVAVGPRTAIVIMTRGHAEDFTVLQWALTTPAGYVGVLGSRSKRLSFLKDLEALGHDRAALESFLHMPVGLDIGAESVDEIAIAICAELIAHRRLQARTHA